MIANVNISSEKESKIINTMSISKPEMYVKGLLLFTFASLNKKKTCKHKPRIGKLAIS